MSGHSGASDNALPLPKGGGATRGLGDGFTPDFNRGTGGYSIQIELPKGHRDLMPNLALAYNSASGDSPFGFGWDLPIPRVQIDTDQGVANYLEPDYLLGGDALVAVGGKVFRPRVENAFQRIRMVNDGWEITDKTGMITTMGSDPASRISGTVGGVNRTFAWLTDRVIDTSGNEIRFAYLRDGQNLYIETIEYAGFEVIFSYENRHDQTVNRRGGFAIHQRLRCASFEVRRSADTHPLIRRYRLEYLDEDLFPSLLTRVSMRGFKRQMDGSILATDAPAVEMTYQPFQPDQRRFQRIGEELLDPPGALGENGLEIVDLDGDGLPDIVQLGTNRPRIWRNMGFGAFSPPHHLKDFPTPISFDQQTTLFDIDGRGTADLVQLEPNRMHFYPNEGDGSFSRPRFVGARSPLSLDYTNADTRFADINGDGRVDFIQTNARALLVWQNQGGENGFASPVAITRVRDRNLHPDVMLSEPGVFVADMTGDGLPDMVHVVRGMVEYWPALGGGRFDRRVTMEHPPQLPPNYDPDRIFMADVDGTGTSDIIYVGESDVCIWRNLAGVRFAPPVCIEGIPGTSIDSVRLVDILGEGRAGILWSAVPSHRRGSRYRFISLSDGKPYLMTSVREEIGLETSIEYGTSSHHAIRDRHAGSPWSTHLPMPIHVVNRIFRKDLVTDTEVTTEIYYHEGQWDSSTRRFRGFGRVTVRHEGEQEAFEEHRYLVTASNEPALQSIDAVKDRELNRAKRGQVYQSTYFTAGPDSAPLRVEVSKWEVHVLNNALDGTPVLFPNVAETVVKNIEAGEHPRVVRASYEYDEYGNVTRERRVGSAPYGDDDGAPVATLEAVTQMIYAINVDDYVVARIAQIVRFDEAGNVTADMRHYYDGPDFVGLPLGEVTHGLLVRQEEVVFATADTDALYGAGTIDWAAIGYHETARYDNVQAWAANQTRILHNEFGMPIENRDAFGHRLLYEYDADGLLVNRLTNSEGHVITATYDPSWQLIETHTQQNGTETRYTYDGLGRTVTEIKPGDTSDYPTIQYTYNHHSLPNSVGVKRRKEANTDEAYEHFTYFDGLGREIQERTRVDGNKVRVTGTLKLNRKGEISSKGEFLYRSGLAFEESNILPVTDQYTYRYDGVGRLVHSTTQDGKIFRVVYSPWAVTEMDAHDTDPTHRHANTPRVQHFDAFGRPSGVSLIDESGTAHTAQYTYDIMGRLIASTDLEGRPAILSIQYDQRGARLRIDHANAGTRTMVYDAGGRLLRYNDERNMSVERTYDTIGRVLTESVNGVVQETYHWDQRPDRIGYLGRIDDQVGSVTFEYDERGNVISKVRQILGKSYRIAYGYDASNLSQNIVYPDGTRVEYDRWEDGSMRSISGFVDEIDYDEQGRTTVLKHANGINESFDYASNDFLSDKKITQGAADLSHTQLSFNAVGQLMHLQENVGPIRRSEDFTYDALGYLRQFERDQAGNQTAWGYNYDADGNLLLSEEMDAADFQYDFNAKGALKRRVALDGSIEDFSFNDAGHLIDTDDLAITYDARGRLTLITKTDGTTVEMNYDYRGARVSKKVRGSNGVLITETRYVDEIYEDRDNITTAYIFSLGRVVGYRRGNGRRHIHTDHRGSVVLMTKPNGQIDTRNWFGPYGSSQLVTGQADSRQFIGTVYDHETGLYYMNHRYYSPAIGRFLTPDPLFLAQPERKLALPEAHNLYIYAKGDPVNYIDPTGLGFWSAIGDAIKAIGTVVAGIVAVAALVVAATVAVSVVATAIAGGGLSVILGSSAAGALIGGIQDGWDGVLLGAMIGFTAGVNGMFFGPQGVISFMGVFGGVRKQGWYKSLAAWSSWFMPASWPGHSLGLGVFLANAIAHVTGSDKQIEWIKVDWRYGMIVTQGGEYDTSFLPWSTDTSLNGHNLGGYTFFENGYLPDNKIDWTFHLGKYQHETGHMLNNAVFGFWQGVGTAVQEATGKVHSFQLFEVIAKSNQDTREGFWDG